MNPVAVGLVYYADDPEKQIVRCVYRVEDDPPDALRTALCSCTENGGRGCGGLLWNAHLDPSRQPVMIEHTVD